MNARHEGRRLERLRGAGPISPPVGRPRRGALVLAVLAVLAIVLAGMRLEALPALASSPVPPTGQSGGTGAPAPSLPGSLAPSYAVGLRVVRLVDASRTIRLRGGRTEPRTLLTYIRYPALGPSGGGELSDAQPAAVPGGYPLIVFAHGFAVTPAPYAGLLDSWAQAGYVVAAPVFPLASAGAPDGPDEADVVNQPADVSFVISSLIALSGEASNPLGGLIDASRIAVAGHSDGGETALAVAYSRRYRDPRVHSAVVLSGAEMSGVGGYAFPPGGPALLAAQGTADELNEPKYTYAYFRRARRPKFLLRLLGARHLPPYTVEQPQLAIVERETLAFFSDYLQGSAGALQSMISLGNVARTASLLAEP